MSFTSNSIFAGTRIIYDRKFLLQMRNSPLAKSPPANLPVIPGVTIDDPSQKSSDNGYPEPIAEKPNKGSCLSTILKCWHYYVYSITRGRFPFHLISCIKSFSR